MSSYPATAASEQNPSTLMLVVLVLAADEIAMPYISCDSETVIGNRTVWYCFGTIASYQRVNAIASFGNAENAAIFL